MQNTKQGKKQLEQQLEEQTQQLGILQAEIGKSLTRNSVYAAEDLAETIKLEKTVEESTADLT